jgi:4-amino-4-deoxy-L-arabinose transferase-like glycosyltransferase
MTKKPYRFSIIHVLLIAAALRIAFPLFAGLWNHSVSLFNSRDTAEYAGPAQELVKYGTFTIDRVPHIVRTPGYPLLLIPGILAHRLEIVTILLQILLGVFTCYGVYRIGFSVVSPRAATAAALLMAIDPLSIDYTAEISSETLFTALFVCSLWFLVNYLRNLRLTFLLPGTFSCVAAIYVRPVALFLPVLIGLFLLVRAFFLKAQRRRLLFHALVFGVCCFVSLSVWIVRNHAETGYTRFSAIEDINLYYYHAASVIAATEHRPYLTVQDSLGYNRELYSIENPHAHQSPAAHYASIRAQARWIIMAHPFRFAQIYAAGMVRIFIDPGASTYLRMLGLEKDISGLIGSALDKGIIRALGSICHKHPLTFWGNCFLACVYAVFYLLALCGLAGAGTVSDRWGAAFLALCTLYFIGISGGAAAVSRFRHPIMPMICIAAGFGAVRLQIWLHKKLKASGVRSDAPA